MTASGDEKSFVGVSQQHRLRSAAALSLLAFKEIKRHQIFVEPEMCDWLDMAERNLREIKEILSSGEFNLAANESEKAGTSIGIEPIRELIAVARRGSYSDTSGRALVVDDSREYGDSVKEQLEGYGFAVDIAYDWQSADGFIRIHTYDLAVLDIRLSDDESAYVSGLSLIPQVREHNPSASIIVLSAHVSTGKYTEASNYGADAILEKLEVENLDSVINRVALRRETERESVRQTQVAKYVDELLAIFSHELRSPLTIIQRNAEALLWKIDGDSSDDVSSQRAHVETILRYTRREFDLIDSHLQLNRIDRGIEKLDLQTHEIRELVYAEVEAHREEAARHEITIALEMPEHESLANVDAKRFRLGMNPLLDNALKFSPRGGTIRVSLKDGKDYLEIQIRDQGPGISRQSAAPLLELGAIDIGQLPKRVRSSGLGLLIAKRCIDLHQGRLWFESVQNEGTTVAFRIPSGRTSTG